jgi:hypothetical protein
VAERIEEAMKALQFVIVAALALVAGPAMAQTNPVAKAALDAGLFFPDIEGAANPAVTQDNIGSNICVSGWTAKVRPPDSVTEAEKKAAMAKAGIPWSESKSYEWDHHWPIEAGGNPTSPLNLALQSYVAKPWNAHVKDKLENFAHKQICAHKMTLQQAQEMFAGDGWRQAYCAHFSDMKAACAALPKP